VIRLGLLHCFETVEMGVGLTKPLALLARLGVHRDHEGRDLRNQSSDVWRDLAADDVLRTASGRPRVLMTRIDDADLEPLLREIRLARARIALARLQAQARASGAAGLVPRATLRRAEGKGTVGHTG